MFGTEDYYYRTGWGAVLFAVGMLLEKVLTKAGDLITIWNKSNSEALIAKIKAESDARANTSDVLEQVKSLKTDISEIKEKLTRSNPG